MSQRAARNVGLLGLLPSAKVMIRTGSILFALQMIGHASAYPWTSGNGTQENQLLASMKSYDFEFMGEHSTYWNLYFGWGLLITFLLLCLAIILWIISDFASLAPVRRRLAVITSVMAAIGLIGAYLSMRYFYIPPALLFSGTCVVFFIATAQLVSGKTKPVKEIV